MTSRRESPFAHVLPAERRSVTSIALVGMCRTFGLFGLPGGHSPAGGSPGVVFTVCALLAGPWPAFLEVGPGAVNSWQTA